MPENKNVVAEYLVKRIKELEKCNDELATSSLKLSMQVSNLEKEVSRFNEIKKLFRIETLGSTKGIVVYDFDGKYNRVIATNYSSDYQKWIELLELKEVEKE